MTLTLQQVQEARQRIGLPVVNPVGSNLDTRLQQVDSAVEASKAESQIEDWRTQYQFTLIDTRNTKEWIEGMGNILFSIIIVFCVFLIINKVFYYIVLGKINPPKE